MYELQRLRAEHDLAILNFELVNRDYFAESINDRGDEFFDHFAERHRELLAEQESGGGAFYILVDESAVVIGRFNLYEIASGSADVGYRIAQSASGHGVATFGVQSLCRLAAEELGLQVLRATTSNENVASRRVLEKSGFVAVGAAIAGGRDGIAYELVLANN